MNSMDDSLLLYLLQMTNHIPKVVSCNFLKHDMSVVCSLDDKPVPASQYCDLLTNGRVSKLSQLVNLMATNRKFYIDYLCDGTLKTTITDAARKTGHVAGHYLYKDTKAELSGSQRRIFSQQ